MKRTVKSRGYEARILAASRTAAVPLALSSAPGASVRREAEGDVES